MKTTVVSSPRILVFIFVATILLVTACDDNDNDPASDKPACLLVKRTVSAGGIYADDIKYTYKAVFTYEYDNAGNVTATGTTYNYTYSDGPTSSSTSTGSYQYDDAGFLLKRVLQYNYTDRDGGTGYSTNINEYTYEDGRLSKNSVSSQSGGSPVNYIDQYEYNADGLISKYTTTYDNSSVKIEYSGKTIVKVTRTYANGSTMSPLLQYNEKGLLVKAIETRDGYSDEYRYTYTTDGEVAREERYINAKPSSGSVYEYDDKENPTTHIYARKKGVPFIPYTRPEFYEKHNYARYMFLTANNDNTGFKTTSTTVYVYDYNDKNFPIGFTSKTINDAGVETDTQTTTFEYQNCQ